MMLASLSFAALLLSQAGAPASTATNVTPAPAPVPAAAETKEARAARAADHYGHSRFAEAATEFEALYRDYPDEPRFLFNAGTTRYAAHQYAHAVVHFKAYIARGDVSPADLRDAQAQLDEVRNKVATATLSIRVPPGAGNEVEFVVRRVTNRRDARPELRFTAAPTGDLATLVLQLEPGVWSVQLHGAGYETIDQSFDLRGLAAQRFNLSLTAVRRGEPEAPPTHKPREFAIGQAALGGIMTAAGVTVLAAGVTQRNNLSSCERVDECKEDLTRALNIRDVGAGVFGGGAGLLASSLVWLGRDAELRRKLWIGGGILGGVVAAGGAIGFGVTTSAFNSAKISSSWSDYYSDTGHAPLRAVSTASLGLGVGLVLGSVAGLIVQRRAPGPGLRALRVGGSATPWLTGVVVSGRF